MAEPTLTIRRAVRADAPAIAEFAARTFAESYAPLMDPAQMDWVLANRFGPERQAAELEDPTSVYLLAEVGGSLAGYAFVRHGRGPNGPEPPRAADLAAPVEVARFYVAREWHGRGVAQRLMRAVIDEARSRGGRTLWLGVWQRNPRAQAFYRKCGFTKIGTIGWEMQAYPHDDELMVLDLASAAPVTSAAPAISDTPTAERRSGHGA